MSKAIVVIFDFDWSLVNENTDTYIFDVLAPQLVPDLNRLRQEMQWTQLMDLMVKRMQVEFGITKHMVADCLRKIPYFQEMFAAARLAKERNAKLFIISDSNHFYINEILFEHGLDDLWTEIYTNLASFDYHDILSIAPYLDFSSGRRHSCCTCPVNMCKGDIMESVFANLGGRSESIEKVIYVGDGGGDFCPCKRLSEGDIICCREGWRLHKDLITSIAADNSSIRALMVPWNNGIDVLQAFDAHIPNI